MGHMLVQSTHTVRRSLDGTWRAALPLAKRNAQPVPACEWCETSGAGADEALERLLERGGFPEPFLAERPAHAERWRNPYLDGLIREDVLEFSRIHEIRAMRHFVDVLRERVGAPLSLASIARDLQISPITLAKYLDILEAQYVVFAMRPFHRNVARAILKAPKVYFFDAGLAQSSKGTRVKNACAAMMPSSSRRSAPGKSRTPLICEANAKRRLVFTQQTGRIPMRSRTRKRRFALASHTEIGKSPTSFFGQLVGVACCIRGRIASIRCRRRVYLRLSRNASRFAPAISVSANHFGGRIRRHEADAGAPPPRLPDLIPEVP